MKYVTIKNSLTDYDPTRVEVFISYLKAAAADVSKNPWVRSLDEKAAISLFRKVALDGVFIDGDTITLQARKSKILVSYGYQAYKNRMLHVYPESKIDLQLVHDGDDFSFKKQSGQVIYTHDLGNPFQKNRVIIGAYCVIKNSRGEFLTTINQDEIQKMRSVARTQNIWNTWEGQMVLKSVIKRACKTHFYDQYQSIEELDNEQYNVEAAGLDPALLGEVEKAESKEALDAIYKKHIEEVNKASLEPEFLKVLSERKMDLAQAQGV